jgi:hypothetical protein
MQHIPQAGSQAGLQPNHFAHNRDFLVSNVFIFRPRGVCQKGEYSFIVVRESLPRMIRSWNSFRKSVGYKAD